MLAQWQLLASVSLAATIFVGLLAVYYLGSASLSHRQLEDRVLKLAGEAEVRERRQRGFLFAIGDRLDRTGWGRNMRQRLAEADLNITPSEYAGAGILVGLVVFMAMQILFGTPFVLNCLIGLFGAFVLPRIYLRSRRDHYIAAFDSQMSEVALLMSNSLKAGLSVPQSLEVVSEKMERPAGPEFAKTSREIRLGMNLDEALQRMLDRLPSDELRLMITTIRIQRLAGGNLAQALSVMSTAIAARFKLKDEIRTMTAEARYTGILLVFLPIVILALVNRMMEGSVARFLSNPLGFIITGLVAGVFGLAFYLINRFTAIRV